MAEGQVEIHIPGLFAFNRAAIDELSLPPLPCLESWLRYAQRQTLISYDYLQCLLQRFNLKVPSDSDIPAGALTAKFFAQATADKYYLRADPVHFRVDRDRVYLVPITTLDRTETEQFINSLNAHLNYYGMRLLICTATIWVLEIDAPQDLQTQPLQQAIFHRVEMHNMRGKDKNFWRNLLTELQMLLHAHERNQIREREGKVAINSVWLWGYGHLPQASTSNIKQFFGDDPIVSGMAELAGVTKINVEQLSDIDTIPANAAWLCVDTHLQTAYNGADKTAWLQALLNLEQNVFTPLISALRKHSLARLNLYSDGQKFVLRHRDFYRLWRRRHGFSNFLAAS